MHDGAPQVGQAGLPGSPVRQSGPRSKAFDLLACCILVAAACAAYAWLPGGSALRLALALPVLFFAPGYLLVEAVAGPATTAASRAVRALVALGTSPAIVGLLALGAAVLPGGFRPVPILALIAVACAAMAAAALWRRLATGRSSTLTPATA